MTGTGFDRDIELAQNNIRRFINDKQLEGIIAGRIERYIMNKYEKGGELLKKAGVEDEFARDHLAILKGLHGHLTEEEIENQYHIFNLIKKIPEVGVYKEYIVFCRRADPFRDDSQLELVSGNMADWFERSSENLSDIPRYIEKNHLEFLRHNSLSKGRIIYFPEPHKDSYVVTHKKGRAIPLSGEDQEKFLHISQNQ